MCRGGLATDVAIRTSQQANRASLIPVNSERSQAALFKRFIHYLSGQISNLNLHPVLYYQLIKVAAVILGDGLFL